MLAKIHLIIRFHLKNFDPYKSTRIIDWLDATKFKFRLR